MVDGFGRHFRYLRLSVTEVCNFSCAYCLPDGYRKTRPHDFLSVDEIGRLAETFQALGVGKVRLTGGEPSARRDLGEIIARIRRAGVAKIAMTTNGWNLSEKIEGWRDAGLTHLNVSIDALDPAAFRAITGHDRLGAVIDGVDRALALGLPTVKVNAVLLKSGLSGGFETFADFVRDRPVAVRFIELMRTGDNADYFAAEHVSGAVLRDWFAARGWTPRPRGPDDGPAVEYVHPDHAGRLGLIAPYAPGFCDGCNRLRVTARGQLRLCLFGEGGVDLRDLLQAGPSEALAARIRRALGEKPAGHRLAEGRSGDMRHLAQVGG
nr:GTP 3',8-cyclase MoaA [Phenylobacterium aquaticum]